jgi:integral membrane protein
MMKLIPFNNSINRLRVVALLEGWSLLVLLAIAMPLKYFAGFPQAVQVIGMAHGILFIAYIILVIQVKFQFRWPIMKTLVAMAASIVPFGTFYVDHKWLKPYSSTTRLK